MVLSLAVTSSFLDLFRVTVVVKRLASCQWWRFRYWMFNSSAVRVFSRTGVTSHILRSTWWATLACESSTQDFSDRVLYYPFSPRFGAFSGPLKSSTMGRGCYIGGAVGPAALFANGWLVGFLDAQVGPCDPVGPLLRVRNLIGLKVVILYLGKLSPYFPVRY